jgi:hypothetical protein
LAHTTTESEKTIVKHSRSMICRLMMVALAIVSIASAVAADPISKDYSVSGLLPTSGQGDNLSFSPSYVEGIPPPAWSQGPVELGAIYQFGPNPNAYPGGNFNDIVYNNAPFTIVISPSQVVPNTIRGYSYSITGPADDGAVIHGVINGVLSAAGNSNLVATFQSVTPNDMTTALGNYANITYQVNQALSNPFPIDQLVLPQSLDLALGGYTNIDATIVPEPASLTVFLALAAALLARAPVRRQWL